jgi:hypothetical protein
MYVKVTAAKLLVMKAEKRCEGKDIALTPAIGKIICFRNCS